MQDMLLALHDGQLKAKRNRQVNWFCIVHAIAISFVVNTIKRFMAADDRWAVMFNASLIWRYYRLFIFLFVHLRLYLRPRHSPEVQHKSIMSEKDVTIIIPTVSTSTLEKRDLKETLVICLSNKPGGGVIVVTDTPSRATEVEQQIREIRSEITNGTSEFLLERGLGPIDISDVNTIVESAGVANKRAQMVHGIRLVRTPLTTFTDDHVYYKDDQTIRICANVFDDPHVGLCGTIKTVRRQTPTFNLTPGRFSLFWKLVQLPRMYWQLYWNFLGTAYLTRHNYEITATNFFDGVFVVSSRTCTVRTELLQNSEFYEGFMNEWVFFGLIGPLVAADDNFITRWVFHYGYDVKIRDKTSIETTLGEYPKYISQCWRWRDSTFKTALKILFNPEIWLYWPMVLWLSYIPMLQNLALFWDGWMVYTLTRTKFFSEAPNPWLILISFGAFVHFSKLPKLIPHFRRHPIDFFLFFFPIPAYHLFAYFHSIISIWAIFTIWDTRWAGRDLAVTRQPNPKHRMKGN